MSWFSLYARTTYRFTLIAQPFRFIFRLTLFLQRYPFCLWHWTDVVGAVFPFHFSCHSLACIQFDFTFISMRISFRLGLGWFHTVDIMILRFRSTITRRLDLDVYHPRSCINVLDEPIVFILFLLLFGMFFALFIFFLLFRSTFRPMLWRQNLCVHFYFVCRSFLATSWLFPLFVLQFSLLFWSNSEWIRMTHQSSLLLVVSPETWCMHKI